VLGEHAAGQGGWVVESAGDAYRLVGQRPGLWPVDRYGVLQLAGERRSHLGLSGCAAAVQSLPGVVEHTNKVRAGHREAGADAVQAKCHRAEELGMAARCGLGPCRV
jgi:hypothetical protein